MAKEKAPDARPCTAWCTGQGAQNLRRRTYKVRRIWTFYEAINHGKIYLVL